MNKNIKTLNNLYDVLNKIYKDIYPLCSICEEEDCKGYLWLLPDEVKELFDKNISIIEINKKINFINPFEKKKINTEIVKPPCKLRCKNDKCSVYKIRPLVCRLYPIDFKILSNEFWVVLHTDCLYVQKALKNKKIDKIISDIVLMFDNIDKKLLNDIINTYKSVNIISKYPKDYKHDDYIKIFKINFLKGKLKTCLNAKQFLTLKK